jgi:hypothetical protein
MSAHQHIPCPPISAGAHCCGSRPGTGGTSPPFRGPRAGSGRKGRRAESFRARTGRPDAEPPARPRSTRARRSCTVDHHDQSTTTSRRISAAPSRSPRPDSSWPARIAMPMPARAHPPSTAVPSNDHVRRAVHQAQRDHAAVWDAAVRTGTRRDLAAERDLATTDRRTRRHQPGLNTFSHPPFLLDELRVPDVFPMPDGAVGFAASSAAARCGRKTRP